ncbi:MAG: hypothetical protein KGL39_51125 [Patescibacteria group bacterium]|nr:hypothetical protein [Patescibacteria group bacterium]
MRPEPREHVLTDFDDGYFNLPPLDITSAFRAAEGLGHEDDVGPVKPASIFRFHIAMALFLGSAIGCFLAGLMLAIHHGAIK